MEAIPVFKEGDGESVTIVEFLERIGKVSLNEPTLTRIYFLKLRLEGHILRNVEDMEADGMTFEEICNSLRKRYSRKRE